MISFCHVVNCGSSDYQCDNGQCIDANLECDGTDNCFDGSDEACSSKYTSPISLHFSLHSVCM